MPVFKDYVCAFQLACESFALNQAIMPCSGDTPETKAYAVGYRLGMSCSAATVIQMTSQALAEDMSDMPETYFSQPEETAADYLECLKNRLILERNQPGYEESLAVSRGMTQETWPLEDELTVSRAFNALSGTEEEHNAFDRGVLQANRDFFHSDLPTLIEDYQEIYAPEDNLYVAYEVSDGPENDALQYRMQ